MRYTDAKAVYLLAGNVIKDTKRISSTLGQLSDELKTLKGSFLDDGILEVESYIKSISSHTEQAAQLALIVSKQLEEYGDLLLKGK